MLIEYHINIWWHYSVILSHHVEYILSRIPCVLECLVSILQKSLFMGLDKCWAYISDLGFSYCLYILLLYLFLNKCL